jgi:hypothetical protein
MPISKSLYTAPQGLAALNGTEPDIEIEIEDPEALSISVEGEEIFNMEEVEDGEDFNKNLAEEIDAGALEQLAGDLEQSISDDKSARKDWEEMYKDGITLLGLKFEERTEPWDGACGVFHPMITEAVVRFQSETIM